MTESFDILLLGYGNMGRALARGWIGEGRNPATIHVTDIQEEAQRAIEADGLSAVVGSAVPPGAEIVVLAVKPQQVEATLRGRSALFDHGAALLSVVAGTRTEQLSALIGARVPVIRAMPNTPAAVAEAMTVLHANRSAGEMQREQCEELMRAVGRVEWVDREELMDVVTALSGSGPAYVFLLIECLAAAGARMGLPDELAGKLALQTVAGSAIYARAADLSVDQLRKNVTSPGGTTEAALRVLMSDSRLETLIEDAIRAATERSKELSGR